MDGGNDIFYGKFDIFLILQGVGGFLEWWIMRREFEGGGEWGKFDLLRIC